MVLDDILFAHMRQPLGDYHLLSPQPALAKVNRQLRGEVLPMWYSNMSFAICIEPTRHSEIDQVWQRFLDRFRAHTAGADGSHHLFFIKRIRVQLWHPALEPGPSSADSPFAGELHYDAANSRYRRTGEFHRILSNGVELDFGPKWLWELDGGARGNGIDWTDRAAVRAVLEAGIMEAATMEARRGDGQDYIIAKFWDTFPLERLVNLAMMIGGECKEAAQFLHVETWLAPLKPPGRQGY